MAAWLSTQGQTVNRKRVVRLMRAMGLAAIYPGPRLSTPAPGYRIYPYQLRGVQVERVNQVWSTDITYIRLPHGFVYLTAVIDWFSRYVLAWLVQPVCAGLGGLDDCGRGVLRHGPFGGVDRWATGSLQHGSGQPVHEYRVYGSAPEP